MSKRFRRSRSLTPPGFAIPMRPMIIDILLVLGGYLFGSISTAILTCHLMGLPDPRSEGSGNPIR